MDILSTAGHYGSRRNLINEVNAAIGSEFDGLTSRAVPVRFGYVTSPTANLSAVTVNGRLWGAALKAQLIEGARALKAQFQPDRPAPKPGPAPEPTAEPTIYFRTEDNNLFHLESHTGIEPAEFYAVRADAVNAGLTPDGVCNP